MPGRDKYELKAAIVVEALFPHWNDEQKNALVWLIADFLKSLDSMANQIAV